MNAASIVLVIFIGVLFIVGSLILVVIFSAIVRKKTNSTQTDHRTVIRDQPLHTGKLRRTLRRIAKVMA
jgi:hypothetical protein